MPGGRAREDDLYKALGDPTRRRILREMQEEGEISPSELSIRLRLLLSGVSYHVRILRECCAIELVRTEQVRGSTQHFYRFNVKEHWALVALEADE